MRCLAALIEAMKGRDDVLFLQSIIAPAEVQKRYEDRGFPCFEDPTRAVAAMAALMRFGISFAAPPADRPDIPEAVPLPDGDLGEREAKAILSAAGLPLLTDELATSAAGAQRIADAMATSGAETFALKIASPDIAHKTDVGGVKLGVERLVVGEAFDDLVAAVSRSCPDARIDGVLVAPMVGPGVDCILGAKIDPVFGPVVMFGLGGVFAEVLHDVALRHAPVSVATAHDMIGELKGRAILQGARGTEPADVEALAAAISRLSIFAAAHAFELESVEINPLRAYPDRCVGLDALIVKSSPNQGDA